MGISLKRVSIRECGTKISKGYDLIIDDIDKNDIRKLSNGLNVIARIKV